MPKLNEEQKNEIYITYTTNRKCTLLGLSKTYGVSRGLIRRMLIKHGATIRTNISEARQKYELNNSYFNTIDSAEKAYHLGLMFSDGYLDKRNYCVYIALQIGDRAVLERFKKSLGFNGPVSVKPPNKNDKRMRNLQDMALLQVYNKELALGLESTGCITKKSLVVQFPNPEILPEKFVKSFILGYFDGNGSIAVFNPAKCKTTSRTVTIMSTFSFCESIKNIVEKILDVHVGISIRNRNGNEMATAFICGNRQTEIFLDWLYDGENFKMERKYQKYLDLKNYQQNKLIE